LILKVTESAEDLLPEDEEEAPPAPNPELTGLLANLESRCSKANLKTESTTPYQGLIIWFPNGPQKRRVYIGTVAQANELLSQAFENFVFLGEYEAICSYDEGYIEASILPFRGPATMTTRQMFGLKLGEEDATRVMKMAAGGDQTKFEIELWSGRQRLRFIGPSFRNRKPSLVIRNAGVQRHDDAIRLLEKIANAVFFEFDLMHGTPMGLSKERRPQLLMRSAGPGTVQKHKVPAVPNCSYDSEPMSLYWYARSATGMPLLQFLAFYQSIEYYLPIYSQNEAIKRLRNLMKDPRFNIHDDGDMTRVLSSVQMSRAGGYGDERSQLRATLQACLDADELSGFLTSQQPVFEFFTKGDWKLISGQQLPLNSSSADLRVNVAERIYDIRNKIVHSKSDGGGKDQVLLPFSKEADMLGFDIALTQFVSRKVLIANSSKLTL
jgi:hypothetical protein